MFPAMTLQPGGKPKHSVKAERAELDTGTF